MEVILSTDSRLTMDRKIGRPDTTFQQELPWLETRTPEWEEGGGVHCTLHSIKKQTKQQCRQFYHTAAVYSFFAKLSLRLASSSLIPSFSYKKRNNNCDNFPILQRLINFSLIDIVTTPTQPQHNLNLPQLSWVWHDYCCWWTAIIIHIMQDHSLERVPKNNAKLWTTLPT